MDLVKALSSQYMKPELPEMKVGGPAICGGSGSQEWVKDFLTFCRDNSVPIDFVPRHAYMGQSTTKVGRYTYHEMCPVQVTYDEMKRTREIIDSFPEYRGMEMHITEFNTSYNPFCPIHDTNLNAAYIAGLLGCLGDVAASYSYWTFGDVFEELGVPARPFHGGFGMIANQLIIKPTMWTFAFFNNLKGECVYRDEHAVVMKRADGSYEGVCWNICRDDRDELDVAISLPAETRCTLLTRTVDEVTCNPLKAWHDMGEPSSLNREQLAFLQQAGQPACASDVLAPEGGNVSMKLHLRQNAVVHFTLTPSALKPDEGYDYGWYIEHA